MTQHENDMTDMEQLVTEALLREQGSAPDVDAEWQRVSERLDNRHRRRRHAVLWSMVAGVAACVVVAVLLWGRMFGSDADGLIYAARQDNSQVTIVDEKGESSSVDDLKAVKVVAERTSRVCTLVVPEGKDMKITLADGTEVWLNAGSSLTYPTRFEGKNREVKLKGEAYFKVSHDARHPFIVNAEGVSTKVLGTQFNVRCYSPTDTHVTLVEGKVSVNVAQHQVVIHPGEDAQLASGRLQVKDVNVDDMTCWRDGIQLFDNATLREILMQMGSWYNLNVVCHDNNSLNRQLHYMYDRRASIEMSLSMLRQLTKVNIKVENNTIFVE